MEDQIDPGLHQMQDQLLDQEGHCQEVHLIQDRIILHIHLLHVLQNMVVLWLMVRGGLHSLSVHRSDPFMNHLELLMEELNLLIIHVLYWSHLEKTCAQHLNQGDHCLIDHLPILENHLTQ